MSDQPKPQDLAYDDFAKIDIRSGTITSAELIPKSKKLLKLQVFFGAEVGTRTILAGIAESFDATMLLAAHDENTNIWLVNPGPVPDGTSIG